MVVTLLLSLAMTSAADDPKIPAAAGHRVDFHKEILPILQRRCAECHVGPNPKGKLGVDTREAILKGGESGPAAVVGKGGESLLVALVAGMDPDRVMPSSNRPRLSVEEVGVLRAWIDQGMSWEPGITISRPVKTARLEPRRPKLTAPEPGAPPMNPIDLLLLPYYSKNGIAPGVVVSDRVFARRTTLDLVGLLPTPEEVEGLEKDTRPDKRERFVRRLLDDRADYAEHWLTFWNDALRNAYRGTGFIDDGRRQITGWLFKALYDDMPYDEFVRELIKPVPGSEGFIKGIVWRGVVNASQRKEMQAAQVISQVFLGTNLKCASCHDSFINQWKLDEAYGLANVFADAPLEVNRCDKPTGRLASTAFLFPSLGTIDAKAPKDERLKQLAALSTSPQNGRLSRTIVNRLWACLFGRGLVETVDDMDQPPWDADLLDWLAADLQDHGYDLKRTLALIATSRAYQSASVGAPRPEDKAFVFRGPLVKRMSAEQFVDAVAQLTDASPAVTPDMLKRDGRNQGGQLAEARAAVGTPTLRVRAALAEADTLTRALGRPDREQVVTRRDSIATTLQALELTNGAKLSAMLKAGAKTWLGRPEAKSPDRLIDAIYRAGIGRSPTPEERAVGRDLVGSPADAEGVEDLLWVVTMLPEFQLIR